MIDFPVPDDASLEKLVAEMALELTAIGWKMATAESCTGGWIAKCCTDLAGSSAWFERGFVTYSDAAKKDALGIDARILQEAGAVSRAVALQMAEGARRRAGVDIAVAVTGIAGPEGGTLDKPVGTVHLELAEEGAPTESRVLHLPGGRERVRWLASQWALDMLRRRLLSQRSER